MQKETKTEIINIRVSKQEKEFIKLTSTLKEFKSISDYITCSLIYPQALDRKKSQSMLYEFNKVGVNINQLTRKINQSDDLTKNDKAELLQYFELFHSQFEQIIEIYKEQ